MIPPFSEPLCIKVFQEIKGGIGFFYKLMVSMTRDLFCKVRGADGLPADIVEEMDCLAVVRNARYNRFFGEWESAEFKNMVSLTSAD